MLSRPGNWVWDTWYAHDGAQHHAFHLYAPVTPEDERRRHRSARIGHAVSTDLVSWTLLPDPFAPGRGEDFDATATWTGSVVRDADGGWRMFYTGARFLGPAPHHRNVQAVGMATSDDLVHWHKRPGPLVEADPRWYELLGDSLWWEQAWRDPWVFADPGGAGWHMLVSARAAGAPVDDAGVIGHAVSDDLEHWQVRPPLTAPGAGFGHLEVTQLVNIDGRWVLMFSCNHRTLSVARAAREPSGGIWAVPVADPTGPYDVAAARLVLDEQHYAGRLVDTGTGAWSLLAFRSTGPDGFVGVLDDPIPVRLDASGFPLPVGTATGPRHRRPVQGATASSALPPLDLSSTVGCAPQGES